MSTPNFYDFGVGGTTLTFHTTKEQIYYDSIFLEIQKQALPGMGLAQLKPLPEGSGKTIEFMRYLELAASDTPLTEGVIPDAVKMSIQQLRATVEEYGFYTQLSEMHKLAAMDPQYAEATEVISEQFAITRNLKMKKVWSNGIYPMRADLDTLAVYEGTITSATTTTFVCTGLSSNAGFGTADDDLNQSIIIMLSGKSKGQSRVVRDWVTGTSTGTVLDWDMTPAAGDRFRVVSFDDIAAGDVLGYAIFKAVLAKLRRNRAGMYPGQYYAGLLSPEAIAGLQDDPDFKLSAEYGALESKSMITGEIGKFMGTKILQDTGDFRFPTGARGTAGELLGVGAAGANYSDTGTASLALFLGKNAFGATTFRRKKGELQTPIIYKRDWDKLGQPIPRYGTMGWYLPWVDKSLQAMWAIGVAHGVSN